MDWNSFQRHFCDPEADDCHQRITVLLSYTMMRRTMKTTILNRPIITLPPPHPEIQYIQFSPEEQVIYRIVSITAHLSLEIKLIECQTENRFRSHLNRYFAKGIAPRNYGVF